MIWGIFATGSIANNFAKTITQMQGDSVITAVASRDLQKAQAFAEKYDIPKQYGSYDELVNDSEVDVVYVATSHSAHYENMKLCLENGKHVLCEKSFTVSAAQAEKIYALAKEKGLFVMEAFWTKLIPVYRKVEKLISDGVIGEVRLLTAQYGFSVKGARAERKFDPQLAGGALLDIGVYNIGFAAMILGYNPKTVFSSVSLNELGTDDFSGIMLQYENGAIAQLTTAIQTDMPTLGCIYGSKGCIDIPNFKKPEALAVHLTYGSSLKIEQEYLSTGFEFEIREVEECILSGKTYSSIMSPEQSICVMRIMDRVREIWQMRFPFEE